ncbi:MAG: class I SAM-dependent methyltransferase [Chitinophagaceae bacterium]
MSNHVNERWAKNTANYDTFRPSVPAEILNQVVSLYGEPIDCVLDLGCGTGLSTKPWSPYAKQVIGIDPSEEMLAWASKTSLANIRFMQGSGNAIPLPDGSVDIVACHASIHWMEPESSILEIMRVLKPQGMLVLLNHNWPPLSNNLALDATYFQFKSALGKLVADKGYYKNYYYRIDAFSTWLYKAKRFDYFREFHMHQSVEWSAEQYLGFTYTYGDLTLMLQEGVSKADMRLDVLEEQTDACFKQSTQPLMFTWRVDLFKNKR